MPEFDRLLLFRALRPDRLTAAMARFVANILGAQYITSQPFDLERSFQVPSVIALHEKQACYAAVLFCKNQCSAGLGGGHPDLCVPVAGRGCGGERGSAGAQAGLYRGRRQVRGRVAGAGPGADRDGAADAGAPGGRLGAAAEHPPHHRLDRRPAGEGGRQAGAGLAPRLQARCRRVWRMPHCFAVWQTSLHAAWKPFWYPGVPAPYAATQRVGARRLFLSAEPPPLLERALPISLLQNSIKLTNEPPEGLKVRAHESLQHEHISNS